MYMYRMMLYGIGFLLKLLNVCLYPLMCPLTFDMPVSTPRKASIDMVRCRIPRISRRDRRLCPSTCQDPDVLGGEPSFTFYFAIGLDATLTRALRTIHLQHGKAKPEEELARDCLCKLLKVSPLAET